MGTKIYKITCPVCNKNVESIYSRKIYCSKNCFRVVEYAKRRKARRIFMKDVRLNRRELRIMELALKRLIRNDRNIPYSRNDIRIVMRKILSKYGELESNGKVEI